MIREKYIISEKFSTDLPFWDKIIILVFFRGVKVYNTTANKKGKKHPRCTQTPSKMPTLSKICWYNNSNSHQSVPHDKKKKKKERKKSSNINKKSHIYSLIRTVGET